MVGWKFLQVILQVGHLMATACMHEQMPNMQRGVCLSRCGMARWRRLRSLSWRCMQLGRPSARGAWRQWLASFRHCRCVRPFAVLIPLQIIAGVLVYLTTKE